VPPNRGIRHKGYAGARGKSPALDPTDASSADGGAHQVDRCDARGILLREPGSVVRGLVEAVAAELGASATSSRATSNAQ